jgi:hypothetical protein
MRRKVVAVAAITAALTLGLTGMASAHNSPHNDDDTTPTPGAAQEVALADSCDDAALKNFTLHDGFQSGEGPTKAKDPRCVDTQFGAVSAFEKNPTLLITKSPLVVRRNQDIVLKVSTQNLIRDRFLGAANGGYYIESATLTDGFTRGHFHTGCRMLTSNAAPDPFRLNGDGVNRFVATEDSKGGDKPDTVVVTVKGFNRSGVVQCAAWAGDGSHRIPMMSFANEIPAFDAVRVFVR